MPVSRPGSVLGSSSVPHAQPHHVVRSSTPSTSTTRDRQIDIAEAAAHEQFRREAESAATTLYHHDVRRSREQVVEDRRQRVHEFEASHQLDVDMRNAHTIAQRNDRERLEEDSMHLDRRLHQAMEAKLGRLTYLREHARVQRLFGSMRAQIRRTDDAKSQRATLQDLMNAIAVKSAKVEAAAAERRSSISTPPLNGGIIRSRPATPAEQQHQQRSSKQASSLSTVHLRQVTVERLVDREAVDRAFLPQPSDQLPVMSTINGGSGEQIARGGSPPPHSMRRSTTPQTHQQQRRPTSRGSVTHQAPATPTPTAPVDDVDWGGHQDTIRPASKQSARISSAGSTSVTAAQRYYMTGKRSGSAASTTSSTVSSRYYAVHDPNRPRMHLPPLPALAPPTPSHGGGHPLSGHYSNPDSRAQSPYKMHRGGSATPSTQSTTTYLHGSGLPTPHSIPPRPISSNYVPSSRGSSAAYQHSYYHPTDPFPEETARARRIMEEYHQSQLSLRRPNSRGQAEQSAFHKHTMDVLGDLLLGRPSRGGGSNTSTSVLERRRAQSTSPTRGRGGGSGGLMGSNHNIRQATHGTTTMNSTTPPPHRSSRNSSPNRPLNRSPQRGSTPIRTVRSASAMLHASIAGGVCPPMDNKQGRLDHFHNSVARRSITDAAEWVRTYGSHRAAFAPSPHREEDEDELPEEVVVVSTAYPPPYEQHPPPVYDMGDMSLPEEFRDRNILRGGEWVTVEEGTTTTRGGGGGASRQEMAAAAPYHAPTHGFDDGMMMMLRDEQEGDDDDEDLIRNDDDGSSITTMSEGSSSSLTAAHHTAAEVPPVDDAKKRPKRRSEEERASTSRTAMVAVKEQQEEEQASIVSPYAPPTVANSVTTREVGCTVDPPFVSREVEANRYDEMRAQLQSHGGDVNTSGGGRHRKRPVPEQREQDPVAPIVVDVDGGSTQVRDDDEESAGRMRDSLPQSILPRHEPDFTFDNFFSGAFDEASTTVIPNRNVSTSHSSRANPMFYAATTSSANDDGDAEDDLFPAPPAHGASMLGLGDSSSSSDEDDDDDVNQRFEAIMGSSGAHLSNGGGDAPVASAAEPALADIIQAQPFNVDMHAYLLELDAEEEAVTEEHHRNNNTSGYGDEEDMYREHSPAGEQASATCDEHGEVVVVASNNNMPEVEESSPTAAPTAPAAHNNQQQSQHITVADDATTTLDTTTSASCMPQQQPSDAATTLSVAVDDVAAMEGNLSPAPMEWLLTDDVINGALRLRLSEEGASSFPVEQPGSDSCADPAARVVVKANDDAVDIVRRDGCDRVVEVVNVEVVPTMLSPMSDLLNPESGATSTTEPTSPLTSQGSSQTASVVLARDVVDNLLQWASSTCDNDEVGH